MNMTRTPTSQLFSSNILLIIRLLLFFYIAWVALNQISHPLFYLTTPLALISGLLSLLVLEHFRYDLRSSAVLLLIICQLYFFGRLDFVSQPWGWYFVLGHAAYLLFMVGLLVGVKLFGKRGPSYLTKQRLSYSSAPARRLYIVGYGTLAGFVLGLNYLLSLTGASGSFVELIFQSLATRLTIAESGLSPLLQFIYILSNFGLGCGFVLWRDHRRSTLIIAWVMVLGYSALVLGSRGAIILPLMQILLATSLLLKRPLILIGSLALPLLIAVNVFSTWYLAAREGHDSLGDESYSVLNRFDAYENWLGFSASQGMEIAPFASIPAAFLQFVPRRLYQEKPYYFSTEMTRTYIPSAFDNGINFDFGGIAESIYNFGPLGAPIFGLFIGWVVCMIDRFKERACQFKDSLSAYIFSVGALIPSFFFTVGWINSALIFAVIGFIINIKIFNLIAARRNWHGKTYCH